MQERTEQPAICSRIVLAPPVQLEDDGLCAGERVWVIMFDVSCVQMLIRLLLLPILVFDLLAGSESSLP